MGLLGFQDIRTIDPMPKAYFGTFDYGDHKMLNFNKKPFWSLCLYGRDELVYNLEFLKIPETAAAVIQDIHPSAQTVIVTNEEAAWYLWPFFDKNTYRPTFRRNGFKPQFMGPQQVLNLPQLPDTLYTIAFPYCQCDINQPFENLYLHKTQKIFDLDGYKTAVYKFSNPVQH